MEMDAEEFGEETALLNELQKRNIKAFMRLYKNYGEDLLIFAYSQLNDLLFGYALGWEKAYTLDYRARIKPWLTLQPTVQYFDTIAGNNHRPSGVVVGLRTGVTF